MKQPPEFIKHWCDIQQKDDAHYPDSTELLSIGSPFSQVMGLKTFDGREYGDYHEIGFLCSGKRYVFSALTILCKPNSGPC